MSTTAKLSAVKTIKYGNRSAHIVFVDGQPDPDMPRPPYLPNGQDDAVDAAWRRYNRAEIAIMRAVAADRLSLDPSTIKFSRNAGCSTCSCSPGLLIEATDEYPAGSATYIKITDVEIPAS
jgi:hypothetical protein